MSITITGEDGKSYQMDDVKSINGLNLPPQFVDIENLQREWKYLKEVNPKQLEQGEPKILIGQAHWDLIQPLDCIRGHSQGPALSKTKLGWVLHGIIPSQNSKLNTMKILSHWQGVHEDDELHQLVKRSFTTEEFGVKVLKELPRSNDDIRAQEIMERTTKRIGERWEVGLLWRDENIQLPESKSMAIRRLTSMEKKLDKDEKFA